MKTNKSYAARICVDTAFVPSLLPPLRPDPGSASLDVVVSLQASWARRCSLRTMSGRFSPRFFAETTAGIVATCNNTTKNARTMKFFTSISNSKSVLIPGDSFALCSVLSLVFLCGSVDRAWSPLAPRTGFSFLVDVRAHSLFRQTTITTGGCPSIPLTMASFGVEVV